MARQTYRTSTYRRRACVVSLHCGVIIQTTLEKSKEFLYYGIPNYFKFFSMSSRE